MENPNINVAGIVSEKNDATVFKGVGDKNVETHFTHVQGQGYHVSEYLSESILGGPDNANAKTKFDQYNL